MPTLQKRWSLGRRKPSTRLGRPIAACSDRVRFWCPGALCLSNRSRFPERYPRTPEVPLVRGRVGNQDKKPWKTLAPPQGTVERRFLRPALLGESVAPFRLIRPLRAVIPWDDESRKLMNARMAGQRGYPRLAEWLDIAEALWEEKGKGRRSFLEQYDYFGQLSAQFPIAPIRVVLHKGRHQPCSSDSPRQKSVGRSQALLGAGAESGRRPFSLRDSQQRGSARGSGAVSGAGPVGRAGFRQVCVQPADPALRQGRHAPSGNRQRGPDGGAGCGRGPGNRKRIFRHDAQAHPRRPRPNTASPRVWRNW